ncbi:MAG: DUF2326 domain-containing protein [Ignavibacteria bacterium]|nr:DUF2326 domain-containing protein [Ignavibacteria bacterium]
MYLLSLYSEPDGLFQSVEFRDGMNIIYGKKDISNPKNSLNSIGKSTFLDLLDFCLLSSHLRGHNPRFFSAKEIMSGYKIVLEFLVGELQYKIKRSPDDPLYIEFHFGKEYIKYHVEDAKKVLGDLVFNSDEYIGTFDPQWFRTLIVFYLKVQKFQREKFQDPIRFVRDASEAELNQYILFLMGIDNRLAVENFIKTTELKNIAPALIEIEDRLSQKYDLQGLSEINNEISKLKIDCKKLQLAIESFKLGEQYTDAEKIANKLTSKIKELLYGNFKDRKKIESYNESIVIKDTVDTKRIVKLYSELEESFAIQVKKTLDDAIKFRKELSKSRKDFLKKEIERLNENIKSKDEEIHELENERSNIFYFLAAKEAITDLTEAFYNLSEKNSKLTELETNYDLIADLNTKKLDIEESLKKIEKEVILFLREIKSEVIKFYEVFQYVFNSIYMGEENFSNFSIIYNPRKKSIIDIDVALPDMFGKGKNQGRTLIFDISILLNSFKISNNFPKFLVHDGIFDGMDKAHFIKLYEFIEEQKEKGIKLQYIVTLNEEGTLSQKFGNADKVRPEIIENEAILVLTPTDKLFKKDFDNRIFGDQSFY